MLALTIFIIRLHSFWTWSCSGGPVWCGWGLFGWRWKLLWRLAGYGCISTHNWSHLCLSESTELHHPVFSMCWLFGQTLCFYQLLSGQLKTLSYSTLKYFLLPPSISHVYFFTLLQAVWSPWLGNRLVLTRSWFCFQGPYGYQSWSPPLPPASTPAPLAAQWSASSQIRTP